jgi:hypothetical protein
MHFVLRCTVKTATLGGTFVENIMDGIRRTEQVTCVVSSLRTRNRDFLTVKPPLCKYEIFVFLFFTPYGLNFKILPDVHINFLGQVDGSRGTPSLIEDNTPQPNKYGSN